ncbi:hypothetical protein IWW56_002975 [Coemansia sp. RSA 2131]|nr:hypothetical protein IWW56_002975 [Coemansia sp. RSA 2131]
MSLSDIISACLGGGSSTPSERQAPYLSADDAAQMPLEVFVQRSLESAPSALGQSNAFCDIFRKHISGGANTAYVAQVVQDSLTRLASNDTDRAAAQWACQILALAAQSSAGGYHPPQVQGQSQGQNHSYAQAVGTDSAGWEMQQRQQNHQPPQPQAKSDVYVRSYFFPSEESFNALVQFLDSAQSSLDICVFNITDNGVANAIIAAKRRGVDVRIITDDEQLTCKGSDVERLQEDHNIPFKTDNDPTKFMHSKFAVIDRRAVWCGSYNWTVAGRRSNNESVICTNDPETAHAFSSEFNSLWNQFS